MGNYYTQKTLAWIKEHDWRYAITEKWNPFAKIRQDLFGFGDILVVTGDVNIIIQNTSYPERNKRRDKILKECTEVATDWIKGGGEILVVSWRKKTATRRSPKTPKELPDIINIAPLLNLPTSWPSQD